LNPELVRQATAIGGAIGRAFERQVAASGSQPKPHPDCLQVILAAIKETPQLNSVGFVDAMLHWSAEYAATGQHREFMRQLEKAIEWCPPQGLSAVHEVVTAPVTYGERQFDPPTMSQALALLFEMSYLDPFPETAEALRSCFGLLAAWGVSWSVPREVGPLVCSNRSIFARAIQGEIPKAFYEPTNRDDVLLRSYSLGGAVVRLLPLSNRAPAESLSAICDLVEKFPDLNSSRMSLALFALRPEDTPVEYFVGVLQGCVEYATTPSVHAAVRLCYATIMLAQHGDHSHTRPGFFGMLVLVDALARAGIHPQDTDELMRCWLHFCNRPWDQARRVVAKDVHGFGSALRG
jgi:hypothetical protein